MMPGCCMGDFSPATEPGLGTVAPFSLLIFELAPKKASYISIPPNSLPILHPILSLT
jgi:hypothetical protein